MLQFFKFRPAENHICIPFRFNTNTLGDTAEHGGRCSEGSHMKYSKLYVIQTQSEPKLASFIIRIHNDLCREENTASSLLRPTALLYRKADNR